MDSITRLPDQDRLENRHEFDVPSRRTVQTRDERATATVDCVEYGSGWYHDAAIHDAREAHAHPYR